MKALITLALLVFTASAQATTLLKYSIGASFEMNPSERTITIEEDGGVHYTRKFFYKNKIVIKDLANLSESLLTAIKSEIEYVSPNSKVEDTKPNESQCSDDPVKNVSIWRNGIEIDVYKRQACHDFELPEHSADRLVALAKAFYDLSYDDQENKILGDALIEFFVGVGLDSAERSIAVMADGNVNASFKDVTSNQPATVKSVAVLTQTALNGLNRNIGFLGGNKDLVDATPSAPQCANFPQTHTSVWTDGHEFQIYFAAACHEYKRKDWPAQHLNNAIRAFYDLVF